MSVLTILSYRPQKASNFLIRQDVFIPEIGNLKGTILAEMVDGPRSIADEVGSVGTAITRPLVRERLRKTEDFPCFGTVRWGPRHCQVLLYQGRKVDK